MNGKVGYRIGDLVVDVGRGRLMRGGEEIALPKLSFDLLLAMARAAPNLLSIDDLMNQVWPGLVVSPETVIHRVKVLRDALSDDPKAPRYIAGLRGRGYQIIAAVEALQELDAPASPAQPMLAPPAPRRRYLLAIIAALVLVGAIGIGIWLSLAQRAQPAPATPIEKSIAVLPFLDLSEKQDQAYFADGMAEEIRNLLVTIPDLKVIGRTSSFQFRGKAEDVRRVGTALGAGYIVEGSVRRSTDQVRVTAELIDTRNGAQRWSKTYDRDVSDIFAIQHEIATAVVRALQLEVVLVSARSTTPNTEAYDMYLRGMHASDRFDQQGFEEAIAHFRRALELDPNLVHAAEALAEDLSNQASWGYVTADIGWQRAREAAEAALKIDPNSVRARATLAYMHIEHTWDWPAARREIDAAFALAPHDPSVLDVKAQECILMGRRSEALQLLDAALTVDPLDPHLHFGVTWVYLRLGRLAEAEASARRALAISPTYSFGRYFFALVLLSEGKAEEALAEVRKEADSGAQTMGFALVYHALGRSREADAALSRLETEYSDFLALYVAEAYAFRGQKDRALDWLERAYAQRDPALYSIKQEVLLAPLESDPRYKALLRKMKLPE